MFGSETRTLGKIDKKYLESSEMWCWRKMEIICIDHVRNEGVLQRVKEVGRMPGLVTCRNCLLKYVIEGNIGGMKEVTGIRGSRRKQVLDVLKEEEGTGN